MKTQAFRALYDQITPEERVHLFLAAAARGDTDEVARLGASCPRVPVKADDPEYTGLLDGMWHAGTWALCQWLNVSHRVVQTLLAESGVTHLVSVDEGFMRLLPHLNTSPADKKKFEKMLKILVREDRALLVGAKAKRKQGSAVWKGIEAAITRFCAERRITMEQLFAMSPGLPSAIDESREALDADVPADPQVEDEVYQALCHAVRGPFIRG